MAGLLFARASEASRHALPLAIRNRESAANGPLQGPELLPTGEPAPQNRGPGPNGVRYWHRARRFKALQCDAGSLHPTLYGAGSTARRRSFMNLAVPANRRIPQPAVGDAS